MRCWSEEQPKGDDGEYERTDVRDVQHEQVYRWPDEGQSSIEQHRQQHDGAELGAAGLPRR